MINYRMMKNMKCFPICRCETTNVVKSTFMNRFNSLVCQRLTIFQPGYASGDMFSIAATLINDPNADVIISKIDKTDKRDPLKSIVDFYISSGIKRDKIHCVDSNCNWKDEAFRIECIKRRISKNKMVEDGDITHVDGGTKYVAKNFSMDMREKIRTAWKVDASKDNEIGEWLEKKGIPKTGKSVLILWSRFSGKQGEAHLEHDSSYTGIKQIAQSAVELQYDVILIVGDSGYSPQKNQKYEAIANGINSTYQAAKVYNLTEFWKNDDSKIWEGNTRIGQFKLYDYLNRHYNVAVHLGFRSGNLEAMALLGYKVLYMEEPNSIGGKRMEAWHNKGNGKTTEGGMAPGYERLIVSQPPTRSGKFIVDPLFSLSGRDRMHPYWGNRAQNSGRPFYIKKYNKGFENEDIQQIKHSLLYMNTSLPYYRWEDWAEYSD